MLRVMLVSCSEANGGLVLHGGGIAQISVAKTPPLAPLPLSRIYGGVTQNFGRKWKNEMDKQQLLETALGTVANRGDDYGDVYTNHERIAVLWTVIFGREVKAHQVAMAMAAVKLARLVETPDHQDSWIDLAGYAAIGSECIDGEQEANDS